MAIISYWFPIVHNIDSDHTLPLDMVLCLKNIVLLGSPKNSIHMGVTQNVQAVLCLRFRVQGDHIGCYKNMFMDATLMIQYSKIKWTRKWKIRSTQGFYIGVYWVDNHRILRDPERHSQTMVY